METSRPVFSSDSDKMELENELTNKFLSGKMSFAEYSSEWYADEDEEDLEELVKKQFEDLPQSSPCTSKALLRRRKKTRLTPALVGLMGEANLRLARGDIEMAERMCHEIIKQLPTAAEPFQTLAQIYENDPEKSLQFSLLAAHLSRPDANEWLRLAAISAKRNDYKQELICYTQAIKADSQNLDIHEMRLNRLAALEEIKFPVNNLNTSYVKCYHKIVTCMPASQGEIIMKYARLASKVYHKYMELDKTIDVFNAAYKKCSSLFTLEDINIYLELLITQKDYQTCIDIFISSLGIEIEAEIQTVKNSDGDIEEQTNYLNCRIPDNLAVDLKSKLLVCFIHLGAVNLVESLLNNFMQINVETAGDLYMDIEEAFSSVGLHNMAIKVLEPLVKNSSFDLGAVWLKYAECLYRLNRIDDAVESFYKVLKHVPQHPEARKQLFSILENKGCIDEALNILQQDYRYVVSPSLLYEQCKILKKYDRPLKYLEIGEALLMRATTKFRHEEEIKIARRTKGGLDLIFEFRKLRGENQYHEDDIQFEDEPFKLNPKEEWDMFKELLNIAFRHKLYPTMERLTFSAFISKGLSTHRAEIEYLCLQACLLNKDFTNALRLTKEFIKKNSHPLLWNLLGYTINLVEEIAHIRYLTRLFNKEVNTIRYLLIGNNYLSSGRYIVALKYFLEYHEQCREPISALLIALSMFSLTSQKFVDKHHNLMLQGLSYMLTYKRLRNCDQEAYYNLGRTFQMLNINNLAIDYYERALKCGPITKCEQHGDIDLIKETAFNLYVLYKEHSPDIARRYMLKYLVLYNMDEVKGFIVPANLILFSKLTCLFERLHRKTKQRHEQNKALENFIMEFRMEVTKTAGKKNTTFFPILRLLLPDCDRERIPYNLKETKLGALLVSVLSLNKQTGAGKKLLNFRSVHSSSSEGDFAGVAYYELKDRVGQKISTLTVGDINEILDTIANAQVGNKGPIRDDAFSYVMKKLTPEEFKWFLRIILKDLKLGMSAHRILAAFHPDAPEFYQNCYNIYKVCEEFDDGNTRPLELGIQTFSAICPMLSERLDITDVNQLAWNKSKYQVEDKFDGERFQMHMENGVFEYFSRKGYSYSNSYGKTYESGLITPYLKDCFSKDANSFILDGEMMGWHKENQYFGCKGMSYDIKKVTDNSSFRPCYCVFDVLYYNGRSLVGPPEKGGIRLHERLKILDNLFSDVPGVIQHSRRHIVSKSSEILDALNKAIDNQDEGIVVKDIESYYMASKRNAGWYKIKPEYTEGATTDLDLVIVGADEAENKRQGRAKSFHVACADTEDDTPKRWVCVGRVASGLSFAERERVCSILETNWKSFHKNSAPPSIYFNKEKPDLWIMPEHSIVLQIRATEIIRSSSYGADYTLRFPRVMKIRDDKPVKDILTLEEFYNLAPKGKCVEKLSTKRINEEQIGFEGQIKTRRSRIAKTIQVAEQFRVRSTGDVQVMSKALLGRKLCVYSEDEDCKKIDLIKIVESHGGKHTENMGSDTWCTVVSLRSNRDRKLVETEQHDVVHTSWLRNLPPSDTPCMLKPLDMLSMKKATKLSFSWEYDTHSDSYTEEIDVKTLQECFKKMDNEPQIYLTTKEKLELDSQLFEEGNPYSFLRSCVISVQNPLLKLQAKLYGATVIDSINGATHFVVATGTNPEHICRGNSGKVVTEEWLLSCLSNKTMVSETEYLLF